MSKKIFLGGTCASTTWRNDLINMFRGTSVEFFNPQKSDWVPSDEVETSIQKRFKCGVHFYMLTSDMKGVYSIAEMVESSISGIITVVQVDPEGFTDVMLDSIKVTLALLDRYGAFTIVSSDLKDAHKLLHTI